MKIQTIILSLSILSCASLAAEDNQVQQTKKTISPIILLGSSVHTTSLTGYPKSLVNYPAFVEMTAEAGRHRLTRLIKPAEFAKKAKQKKVIVLDTRSKWAFDKVHIKGAVHLNFSDFTKESLAKVIPDKNTTILIYCNNNVMKGGPAVATKMPRLALNIPTFINLYGYGYKDIYELRSLVTLKDKHITFEGTDIATKK